MILLAFRHGLRASEQVDLRWDQVDFQTSFLHVRRAKAGTPAESGHHHKQAPPPLMTRTGPADVQYFAETGGGGALIR
jgi:integrase